MQISTEQALADVQARVTASGSSFTAGMVILPKPRRDAMFALYAFCREVDDIADDGATLELRIQGLQDWREKIALLFRQGIATDTITTALLPAVTAFGLVEADFQAIIDGMEMDAQTQPICAPDMMTLDLYCDRVASAVGRVSVRLFGDSSENAMQVAYHLGRAFQLTNILRDLNEDAQRGRLYLPEELLAKHHITTRVPTEVMTAACLIPACRELAHKAREHFTAADYAMQQCSAKAMKPARMMRAYYGAIFDRLVAHDWKSLTERVRLPAWQKLWLMLSNMVG